MIRGCVLACMAIIVASSLPVGDAKAVCDERQCVVDAPSAQEPAAESAAQGGVEEAATRVRRARQVGSAKKAPRFAKRQIKAGAWPGKTRLASEVGDAPKEDASKEKERASKKSQRRFQAFIDPSPISLAQNEPWRAPRLQPIDFVASPSHFAAPISSDSEARGVAVSPAVNDQAGAPGDPFDAGASLPVKLAPQTIASPVAPAELRRGADAPGESGFLRSLALTLGGAATLASVLRMLVGA